MAAYEPFKLSQMCGSLYPPFFPQGNVTDVHKPHELVLDF